MASSTRARRTFLKSRSPEGLRRLVTRNENLTGKIYKYDPVYHDGKFHIQWFTAEIEIIIKKEDFINKETDIKEIT